MDDPSDVRFSEKIDFSAGRVEPPCKGISPKSPVFRQNGRFRGFSAKMPEIRAKQWVFLPEFLRKVAPDLVILAGFLTLFSRTSDARF